MKTRFVVTPLFLLVIATALPQLADGASPPSTVDLQGFVEHFNDEATPPEWRPVEQIDDLPGLRAALKSAERYRDLHRHLARMDERSQRVALQLAEELVYLAAGDRKTDLTAELNFAIRGVERFAHHIQRFSPELALKLRQELSRSETENKVAIASQVQNRRSAPSWLVGLVACIAIVGLGVATFRFQGRLPFHKSPDHV